MYLKSIKALGFKSFADKTLFEFNPGIIAVVGPNGSGKSNVVDAVRWVLGEQSAKQLRATTSMSDVIFAGSKTRDPHTRAMISLTFDNSDNYLNSEFAEVEIKRVVYKTGENEYYINNSKVRLKDITDLFIDSGVSKESFNIISQGSITDVISSKPEEKRAMFESAAGVLKYKKRKEESVRKLERTKENLERIKLLTKELETTITPLKQQAEVAKKYLTFKSELESIEIALLAQDIFNINEEYTKTKKAIETLTEELATIDLTTTSDVTEIEKKRNQVIKLDEKITTTNTSLLSLTNELAKLSSEKQIMLERKKYEVDDLALQNNIVALKEEELNLKRNIDLLKEDITILENATSKKHKELTSKTQEITELNLKRNVLSRELLEKNKELYNIISKIEILTSAIENDSSVPYAVKSVLNNPRLSGVHSIIGKLIELEEQSTLAIETSLGYASNIVVVDDEKTAKECVNYLKDNKLGRATFFPLNIIKEKFIPKDIIERVSLVDGFIDIASNLVKYNPKYTNIIKNQLGNVLVVKNIDAMNLIGRIIEYKYKIVTLEGEILNPGGAITGGSSKASTGVISQKHDLEKLKSLNLSHQEEIKVIETSLKELTSELEILQSQEYSLNKEYITIQEQLNRKQITYKDDVNIYDSKQDELKGVKATATNKLDKEVEKILESVSKKMVQKELLEKNLKVVKEEKDTLNDKILELETLNRKINSEYHKKQNELKYAEISSGKMDVKLDTLLTSLAENYNMTYEKAHEEYELEIPLDTARLEVNNLKVEIKKLGEINTGAISEYDRLNTRYTFLTKQQTDLETSMENLFNVIEEMDEIMKDKFIVTFDKIKDEFDVIFKKLFKGGQGILKLTDPQNVLETGIDIIAMPPGKKLNSINLLSGGEKSLTAIALLFAMLNVKPSPFCILDEIEAALDEANVDTFCKYLKEKNHLSQFIIITHKKRTMEYADLLYGITMQESGVSKLVSVELESSK